MTTRAKQRAERDELNAARDLNKTLQADNDGLLDILNAVLYANGGKVVVSRAQLIAADRRKIHVTHSPDAVVIETETREEDSQRAITKRLWLPGAQT